MSNYLTPQALANVDTTPKTPRLDFPAPTDRYQQFTGAVTHVETKQLGDNEYISIKVANGDYQAELLVSTEPEKTYQPKDDEDHQKQMERNIATLQKAAKTLDIVGPKGLDLARFVKAKGKLVTFIAKQTGTRTWEGKTYPKIKTIFLGHADDLAPVVGVSNYHYLAPTGTTGQAHDDNDIPF